LVAPSFNHDDHDVAQVPDFFSQLQPDLSWMREDVVLENRIHGYSVTGISAYWYNMVFFSSINKLKCAAINMKVRRLGTVEVGSLVGRGIFGSPSRHPINALADRLDPPGH